MKTMIFSKLPSTQRCDISWMESAHVPLSKSDETLRAEKKKNTGGAPAPGLFTTESEGGSWV